MDKEAARAKKAAYQREWTKRNPEKAKANSKRTYERHKTKYRPKMNAYNRERRKRPEVKEQERKWRIENADRIRSNRRRTNAAYAKRHPDRIAARNAVYYAIRTGKLTRQPCEQCGIVPTHAHHHRGYAKEHRLDVVWLCVTCHSSVTQPDTS